MENQTVKKKRVAWNKGLTKDTCPSIAKAEEKKKKTNLEKYGVENVFQSKEVTEKLSEARHSGTLAEKAMQTKETRYGDKNYNNSEQRKNTKLERYGDENYNNRAKAEETCLEKYGVKHHNQTEEQKEKISKSRIENHAQEKAVATILSTYGSMEEYFQQMHDKMKENGTLGNIESSYEQQYYKKYCEEYGEENVIKQYFDKDRYPFKCDFYIKSTDTFIEINGHPAHGSHPFDETNEEDLQLLEQLKAITTQWSNSCIYTWTNLDVRKLQAAKNNNLNFEMIYITKDNIYSVKI